MRARMALYLAGTDYEHREVLLRDKPAQMLELSPKATVPVFVTNGQVIDESLDILRWALPDVEIDTEIVTAIDGPFKHHLDRYKYASRYDPDVPRGAVDLDHREKAVEVLLPLENRLNSQRFLSGDTLGSTDISTFPFIRQFAAVEPDWWNSEARLSHTIQWLKTCLQSEIFRAVMQKHPVWSAAG